VEALEPLELKGE